MKNFTISYNFSGQKWVDGKVDKEGIRKYLNPLSNMLHAKSDVQKVRHSLIPHEDAYIEKEIRNNDLISDEQKYQAWFDQCKKRILEEETNLMFFLLKHPLLESSEPKPSEWMRQELVMTLQQDEKFMPERQIPRIVAIQDWLETYERTEQYTTWALSTLRFKDLDDLYMQVYRLNTEKLQIYAPENYFIDEYKNINIPVKDMKNTSFFKE